MNVQGQTRVHAAQPESREPPSAAGEGHPVM